MKVYYESFDKDCEHLYLKQSDLILDEDLPESYRPVFNQLVNRVNMAYQLYVVEAAEKWKYNTMWRLRSLEKEIEAEGGCIIITTNGKIETRQFSPELTEKIAQLLKTH